MDAGTAALVASIAVFVGVMAVEMAAVNVVGARRRAVTHRLQTHIVQVSTEEAKQLERFKVLKVETYSAFGPLNAVLARFRPARTARLDLIHADVSLTAFQYLMVRVLLATGLAAVLYLL